MRRLLRCGCLLGLLLGGLLAAVCYLLWTATHGAAAPWPPPAVQLAPAQPEASPAPGPRGPYYHAVLRITVPSPACRVVLAGDAGGRASFWVDDALRLTAHRMGGVDRVWVQDFRQAGRVVPLPPMDVTAALGTDIQQLDVVLDDLAPPVYGSSALWLLPCANAAEVLPTATATPAAQTTPTATAGTGSTDRPAAPAGPRGLAGLWLTGLGLLGLWGLLLGGVLLRGAAPRRDPLARIFRLDLPGEPPLATVISPRDLPQGIALAPLRLVRSGDPAAIAQLVLAPTSGQVEIRPGTDLSQVRQLAALRGTLSGQAIPVVRGAADYRFMPVKQ